MTKGNEAGFKEFHTISRACEACDKRFDFDAIIRMRISYHNIYVIVVENNVYYGTSIEMNPFYLLRFVRCFETFMEEPLKPLLFKLAPLSHFILLLSHY